MALRSKNVGEFFGQVSTPERWVRSEDVTAHEKFTTLVLWHFEVETLESFFNCAVRSSDLTIKKFTTLVLWHFEVETLESFFGNCLIVPSGLPT